MGVPTKTVFEIAETAFAIFWAGESSKQLNDVSGVPYRMISYSFVGATFFGTTSYEFESFLARCANTIIVESLKLKNGFIIASKEQREVRRSIVSAMKEMSPTLKDEFRAVWDELEDEDVYNIYDLEFDAASEAWVAKIIEIYNNITLSAPLPTLQENNSKAAFELFLGVCAQLVMFHDKMKG